MGRYFEPVPDNSPVATLAKELLSPAGPVTAERFCDDDGDYRRRYNVYKITADGRARVLKKSDRREITLYRDFLRGKGFAVPEYLGGAEREGESWLLLEYIDGPDLRRFTPEMALAGAETLARIQNAYWDAPVDGGRFRRYRERVDRRARCLENYPELAAAYRQFLARQEDCPRTLCSGDCLPCNGIFRDGRVWLLDWAFGGVLPYALDAARLIAHGAETREPYSFPFYMDTELRKTFLRAHYGRLERKPDWDQYIRDVRLAALNEYVEFLEPLINDPEVGREEIERSFYYRRARETAESLSRPATGGHDEII